MYARPNRYRNAVVPHIYIDGASRGIDFYKQAFGAVELFRTAYPNAAVRADLQISGSRIRVRYGKRGKAPRGQVVTTEFSRDGIAYDRSSATQERLEPNVFLNPPTIPYAGIALTGAGSKTKDVAGHGRYLSLCT